MVSYWTALIATAFLITGFLGPPLDFLPGRKNFPFLPGGYQLAGLYAVVFLGAFIYPMVSRLRPAQRAWVGALVGSMSIPCGFLFFIIAKSCHAN